MIKKEGDKYVLYSKDGSKKLGEYDSEEQAQEREGQISKSKHARVNILSSVNSGKISKSGNIITIKDVVPVVDDIVMNSGLYPADEINKGYLSLNGTAAPAGHPQDAEGNYISAKEAEAMQRHWIGAGVTNVKRAGDKITCDITINVDQANAMPEGRELIGRCERAMNGEKIDPIHVSTGLMLNREPASGASKGKKYNWIARNMQFDHLAILLNQQGAGTPEEGVGMWLNQDGQQEPVMVCNLEEGEEVTLIEQLKGLIAQANSFIQSKIESDSKNDVQLQGGDENPVSETNHEVNQMKDKITAALTAAGINSAGMSDDDCLAAFAAVQTNPLQDKLTAANEKIATFEAEKVAAVNAQKKVLADKLAVNSSLTTEDFMLMPLERLEALNAKAAPVHLGNAGADKITYQLPE